MKRLGKAIIAATMLMSVGITASAAHYTLRITYPIFGSLQSTDFMYTTKSPYVQPEIHTVETVYYLSPERISSTKATELYSTSGTSRHYFTYKSGYGGADTKVCLSANPLYADYESYTVRGDWSA